MLQKLKKLNKAGIVVLSSLSQELKTDIHIDLLQYRLGQLKDIYNESLNTNSDFGELDAEINKLDLIIQAMQSYIDFDIAKRNFNKDFQKIKYLIS